MERSLRQRSNGMWKSIYSAALSGPSFLGRAFSATSDESD